MNSATTTHLVVIARYVCTRKWIVPKHIDLNDTTRYFYWCTHNMLYITDRIKDTTIEIESTLECVSTKEPDDTEIDEEEDE